MLDKGKVALEYSLAMRKRIASIADSFTEPLGVTTFGYKRIYKNGNYLFLSTNADWVEYHYLNIHEHGAFFQEALNNAYLNDSYIVDWPYDSKDHFLKALNNYGMWHGINFYEWNENCIELCTFSTLKEREGIRKVYLNMIPRFKEFIQQFRLQADGYLICLCIRRS